MSHSVHPGIIMFWWYVVLFWLILSIHYGNHQFTADFQDSSFVATCKTGCWASDFSPFSVTALFDSSWRFIRPEALCIPPKISTRALRRRIVYIQGVLLEISLSETQWSASRDFIKSWGPNNREIDLNHGVNRPQIDEICVHLIHCRKFPTTWFGFSCQRSQRYRCCYRG